MEVEGGNLLQSVLYPPHEHILPIDTMNTTQYSFVFLKKVLI